MPRKLAGQVYLLTVLHFLSQSAMLQQTTTGAAQRESADLTFKAGLVVEGDYRPAAKQSFPFRMKIISVDDGKFEGEMWMLSQNRAEVHGVGLSGTTERGGHFEAAFTRRIKGTWMEHSLKDGKLSGEMTTLGLSAKWIVPSAKSNGTIEGKVVGKAGPATVNGSVSGGQTGILASGQVWEGSYQPSITNVDIQMPFRMKVLNIEGDKLTGEMWIMQFGVEGDGVTITGTREGTRFAFTFSKRIKGYMLEHSLQDGMVEGEVTEDGISGKWTVRSLNSNGRIEGKLTSLKAKPYSPPPRTPPPRDVTRNLPKVLFEDLFQRTDDSDQAFSSAGWLFPVQNPAGEGTPADRLDLLSSPPPYLGNRFLRVRVHHLDKKPEWGKSLSPRTQLCSPEILENGGEYWISFALRLPDGFQMPTNWNCVLQIYGPPYGSGGYSLPPFAIGVGWKDETKGRIMVGHYGGGAKLTSWIGPEVQRNRWQYFLIRYYVSPYEDVGYYELWLDGVQQKMNGPGGDHSERHHFASLKPGGKKISVMISNYRGAFEGFSEFDFGFLGIYTSREAASRRLQLTSRANR